MGFLSQLLGNISGNAGLKVSEQLLFDKVIGFRGVVPGAGTSTIVQNVAIALSNTTNFDICVLDTNFLYPTQYPMLVDSISEKTKSGKDFLDFNGDVSEVSVTTKYRNVYLISLQDRGIIDMMSSRDSDVTVEKVIGALKSYFDIILVDLSSEPSNTSIYTAIKCNKIINVADQSIKCMYNLRKSINTMATLAVPFAKANRVVFNKVVPDLITNTIGVLEQAGMNVIGEIPLSIEIARQGVSGKKIWSSFSSSGDITQFSETINLIVDEIVQKTPLNAKFIDNLESDVKVEDSKEDESITVDSSVKVNNEDDDNDDEIGGII